ncbi:MAG: formate dehydrogenase subunit delta [Gammaproteobacteria bacterium]|jgi:formate dehydrogenase subunit delta
MQTDKLVHMANQIASYFAAYPEERAREEVLGHIKAFWEPRMRAELAARACEADGLHPLARWAAKQL